MENPNSSTAFFPHKGSPKRLRIAFIGGSYNSAVGRTHRIAIEMDQRMQLVAGAFSRNPETSIASAIKYGLDSSCSYKSIEHLITAGRELFDAVIVLTPQDQHVNNVITCLNAGIPVICEKALATTVAEGLSIQEHLIANNGFLAVTYNYTGYPMIRELKQIIKDGRLGTIQQIHMEMPQEGFAKHTVDGKPIIPQDWRLHDGTIPTLSLDLGVHLHMMARFLTNQSPEEVVASSNSYGNFNKIIDNISCLIRYSGNIEGSIWYGKTALGYRNGQKIRVFGSLGSAEWVQTNPENLVISDNTGNTHIVDRGSPHIKIATKSRYQRFKVGHPAGFIEAFSNYYFDIADSLENHLSNTKNMSNEYVFGIIESIEGLKLLNAIAESSKTKRWEKVQ